MHFTINSHQPRPPTSQEPRGSPEQAFEDSWLPHGEDKGLPHLEDRHWGPSLPQGANSNSLLFWEQTGRLYAVVRGWRDVSDSWHRPSALIQARGILTTYQGGKHDQWAVSQDRVRPNTDGAVEMLSSLELWREWGPLPPSLGHSESASCSVFCPWDSPGKNTRVGCRFLLQGIFLTQGLNPGLPHCRQMLYDLSHQGSHFLWKKQYLTNTGNESWTSVMLLIYEEFLKDSVLVLFTKNIKANS